jgi:magnesium chelatase family protein
MLATVYSRAAARDLSPADLPKEGGRFDLPTALGIIAACGHLPSSRLALHEFYGELSLGGELRAVRGLLSAVCAAALEARPVILPRGNLSEAERVTSARIIGAANLSEVVGHVRGDRLLPESSWQVGAAPIEASYPDLADVRGLPEARRALEIAPPLTTAEALETAMVTSASAQGFRAEAWSQRPFRSPHHTSSTAALVGGGSQPAPGEISLAHNGAVWAG